MIRLKASSLGLSSTDLAVSHTEKRQKHQNTMIDGHHNDDELAQTPSTATANSSLLTPVPILEYRNYINDQLSSADTLDGISDNIYYYNGNNARRQFSQPINNASTESNLLYNGNNRIVYSLDQIQPSTSATISRFHATLHRFTSMFRNR